MSGFEGVKKFLDLCRTNIEKFEEEMRMVSQLKLFNNPSDISLLKTDIRIFSETFETHYFHSKVSSWLETAINEKNDFDKRHDEERKRKDNIDSNFKSLISLMCENDSKMSALTAQNIDGKNNGSIKELENEKECLLSKILSCREEKIDFIIEYAKIVAYGVCLEYKISYYRNVEKPSEKRSELKECFIKFIIPAAKRILLLRKNASLKFDSFMRENETLIEETRSFLSGYSDRSEMEPFLDSMLPVLQEWLKSVYNFYYNLIEINMFNFRIEYRAEYINALTEERQRLLDCEVKIHAQISELKVLLIECGDERERSIKKYKEYARDFLLLIDRFFVIKFTIKKLGIYDPNSDSDSDSSNVPLELNEREMHEKIYFWPYICDIDYVIAETQKTLENEKKLADESFSSLEVSVEALKSSLTSMEDKKANGVEATDKDFFSESMTKFSRNKKECGLFFNKVKNIFYSIVYFEKVLIKLLTIARDKLVMHNLLINKINEEISSCSIKKKAIKDGVRTRESDVDVFEQIKQACREASFGKFKEVDGRLPALK